MAGNQNSSDGVEGGRRNFVVRALQAIAGFGIFSVLGSFSAISQTKRIVQKKSSISSVQSTSPFLGEIQLTGINFAPVGWAMCNGQLLSISQNTALFALLGTQFGGDGISTFALPNLQGRIPVGISGLSAFYTIGATGGEEMHTLTASEMPLHTHSINASPVNGTSASPINGFPAVNAQGIRQFSASEDTLMTSAAVNSAGGGQPHNNMPPYLVLNYIIALSGIFPTRS